VQDLLGEVTLNSLKNGSALQNAKSFRCLPLVHHHRRELFLLPPPIAPFLRILTPS
jgi:hypothetical protein